MWIIHGEQYSTNTYYLVSLLYIYIYSLKAVATGDALEALLSKMRGLFYLLCWSILQINSVGLYACSALGKELLLFLDPKKSYFRTVTAYFSPCIFSKLNYEHVVDLLCCSSAPSSLHVQFSLLNILVFTFLLTLF